jgi:hypothetical protein
VGGGVKREQLSEQAVAEVVVAYLEEIGADVYQEVEVSGGVADIVARLGVELWIVEVKTSLSLALLTQAMDRRREAHRVFIAAPYTKNMREVTALCVELGIGLFEVVIRSPGYGIESEVRERASSRRWNQRPVSLAAELRPEHKTHAKAGALGAGGRWTTFRQTCEELALIVRLEPGIAVKAAVEKLKHHYSSNRSAISSLTHWVERGKVPGVKLARSHGTHGALSLVPTEAAS